MVSVSCVFFVALCRPSWELCVIGLYFWHIHQSVNHITVISHHVAKIVSLLQVGTFMPLNGECLILNDITDVCFHGTPCSSNNRSAVSNSSRRSVLSTRSRDRSASFERRPTTTRNRATMPRVSSRSRSGSRERVQTDEISKTLSRLRTFSPASGKSIKSSCATSKFWILNP